MRVSVSGTEVADDWAERWREFHRPVLVGEACGCDRPGRSRGCARSRDRPAQAFGTGAHRPLGSVSSRCCTRHRAARSPTSAAAWSARTRRPRSASSPCSRSTTTWRPSRPRSPTRAATTSSWPGSSGSGPAQRHAAPGADRDREPRSPAAARARAQDAESLETMIVSGLLEGEGEDERQRPSSRCANAAVPATTRMECLTVDPAPAAPLSRRAADSAFRSQARYRRNWTDACRALRLEQASRYPARMPLVDPGSHPAEPAGDPRSPSHRHRVLGARGGAKVIETLLECRCCCATARAGRPTTSRASAPITRLTSTRPGTNRASQASARRRSTSCRSTVPPPWRRADMTAKADGEAIVVADVEAELGAPATRSPIATSSPYARAGDAALDDLGYLAPGPRVTRDATAWMFERYAGDGDRRRGWDGHAHLQAQEALERDEPGPFWRRTRPTCRTRRSSDWRTLGELPASGFQVACFPLPQGAAAPARGGDRADRARLRARSR